jgi:hypothetical protein
MPDKQEVLQIEPLEPNLWRQPPQPDPCACGVFAVHRPGLNEPSGIQGQGVKLAALIGGVSLPPLAELYLAPGSYVVSAKASIAANLGGGMLFAMLGTVTQGTLSWTWLRIPSHGSPGECQVVTLQCVATLPTAGRLGLDAYGGNANYTFLAYDIWLTAQKVGNASVQTV